MSSSEWKKSKLDEVCLNITDGSHTSPPSVEKGYYMASVKDMDEYGFIFENCRMISEIDYMKLIKNGCQPQYGDVLIGKDGARYLEDVFVFKQDTKVVLLSSIAILRPDKTKIISEYLYYFLRNKNTRIDIKNNYGSGSAIPRMVLKDFKRVPVPVPPISEQRAIAETLSALDDKIELNNRINKTLEEMAQAIFKSWFVDYEPFQDGEFEDSELGSIPKGWRVESLDNIANFLNGLAMQKYRPETEEFLPVIKIKELNQGFTDDNSDKVSVNIPQQYIINDGDVIFSWSGTLMIKIWTGGRGGLNQHLFKVTSVNYEKWFYYLWTFKHLEKFKAIAQDKATTIGHIKRSHLTESKVMIPKDSDIKILSNILNPIFGEMIEISIQNRTLIAIRNSLLPKLMSGEIRVPVEKV